jgi:hypothetical protein
LLLSTAAVLAVIGLGGLLLVSALMYCLLHRMSVSMSARVGDLKRDDGAYSFQHTRIKKKHESIAFTEAIICSCRK